MGVLVESNLCSVPSAVSMATDECLFLASLGGLFWNTATNLASTRDLSR
jgi:hypothetical protein